MESELEKIQAGFSGVYRHRNLVLFNLGVSTGFRISELLSLRLRNVQEPGGGIVERLAIERRHMKGKHKGRSVKLSDTIRRYLACWVAEMAKFGFVHGNDPVFCMRCGKVVSRTQIYYVVRCAALAAKITPMAGIGTHTMRKTFALMVWTDAKKRERNGERIESLQIVQQALGHADIKSTMSYMSFLKAEDVDRSILTIGNAIQWPSELNSTP